MIEPAVVDDTNLSCLADLDLSGAGILALGGVSVEDAAPARPIP